MPIKNYTTSIAEEKTVGEIMGILASKGARSIKVDYDNVNRPEAISFVIAIHDVPIPFRLPCNFDGVFRSLASEYKQSSMRARWERNPENRSRARRIAWRIIKDWVAAQMALIEAGQASVAEVFLPYAQAQDGRTMFQRFVDGVAADRTLTDGTSDDKPRHQ